MEFKIEIKQSHTFTDQDFDDLLVTAVEGGINYWCRKVEILGEKSPQTNHFLDITNALINGQMIRFYDNESDDAWDMNLNDFMSGIREYCYRYDVLLEYLMDNYDAGSADSIIQLALFEELIFG